MERVGESKGTWTPTHAGPQGGLPKHASPCLWSRRFFLCGLGAAAHGRCCVAVSLGLVLGLVLVVCHLAAAPRPTVALPAVVSARGALTQDASCAALNAVGCRLHSRIAVDTAEEVHLFTATAGDFLSFRSMAPGGFSVGMLVAALYTPVSPKYGGGGGGDVWVGMRGLCWGTGG